MKGLSGRKRRFAARAGFITTSMRHPRDSLLVYRPTVPGLLALASRRSRPRAHDGRCSPVFSAILRMRSLREAAENAQPLFGTSASTRGPLSQPRAWHGDLAQAILFPSGGPRGQPLRSTHPDSPRSGDPAIAPRTGHRRRPVGGAWPSPASVRQSRRTRLTDPLTPHFVPRPATTRPWSARHPRQPFSSHDK